MTNEQFVALVQAGDREALVELWAGVRGLVWKYARRWAGLGGTEVADLLQAGAIAVLRAADSYDPTAGTKFTTFLDYILKQEFTLATGQQTQRQKQDALQTTASLDTPLAGEGDDALTLADTLPDPAAEAAMLAVGERDFADRRRAAVEAAISSLPEAEQTAIRRKYYRGEPVDFLAHAKALRMLRHPSRSRALMEYW